MRRNVVHIVLRVALLVCLVASAAMFVDYQSAEGATTFCGAEGGCAKVRASALGGVLGDRLPTLGLGVFSALFALAVWMREPRHRRMVWVFAGVSAVGALALILYQVLVIHAVCAYCMAIDTSALVAACAAWWLVADVGPVEPVRPWAWSGLGVAALALTLTWGQGPGAVAQSALGPLLPEESGLPPGVAALHVPGKVNLVQFTDFECPYCRRLHPLFDELLAAEPRLHLTRVMAPLPFHRGAEPAALAYLCAPEGEPRAALTDWLYTVESRQLQPAGIVAHASTLGLDGEELARCMGSAATKKRLAEQLALFASAELQGLPTTFVGREVVPGADETAVRAAVDRALADGPAPVGVASLFVLLAIAVGAMSLWTVLRPGRDDAPVGVASSPAVAER